MTDRQLLEMAALAMWADELGDVGIRWSESEEAILYLHADNQDHNGADREYRWHPILESADAFELAAKLQLDVLHDKESVSVKKWCSARTTSVDMITENIGGDRLHSTRMAIVRAAAVIGKSVKEKIE